MSELAQINFPGVQGVPSDPGIAIGSLPVSSGSAAGSAASGLLSGVGSALLGGIGSGVLSGALGLINSAQNYRRQKSLNKQMFSQNKKLAELTYRQNVDMWKMQTDYNSPENQVARLRSAGVNPALAFGSGNLTGNAEAYPELAYSEWNPRTPQFDFASPISAALDTAQATGTALINAAKLRSENARTIKDLASAGFSDAQTERIWSLLEGDIIRQTLDNSKVTHEIDNIKANLHLTNLKAEEQAKVVQYFDQVQGLRNDLLSAQIGLTKKQQDEVDHKVKNLDASTRKMAADVFSQMAQLGPIIGRIKAQTSLLYSQKRLTDSQKVSLDQDISLFNLKKSKLEQEIGKLVADSSLTWREWEFYCLAHGGILGQNTMAASFVVDGALDEIYQGFENLAKQFQR